MEGTEERTYFGYNIIFLFLFFIFCFVLFCFVIIVIILVFFGGQKSVQVMGTFDGWSQGEHLSPEYTGSFTKFSTTLMLRPGRYHFTFFFSSSCYLHDPHLLLTYFAFQRYEIKFLVDGEWQLSPEFPTVGEGLMENNLLIVK